MQDQVIRIKNPGPKICPQTYSRWPFTWIKLYEHYPSNGQLRSFRPPLFSGPPGNSCLRSSNPLQYFQTYSRWAIYLTRDYNSLLLYPCLPGLRCRGGVLVGFPIAVISGEALMWCLMAAVSVSSVSCVSWRDSGLPALVSSLEPSRVLPKLKYWKRLNLWFVLYLKKA